MPLCLPLCVADSRGATRRPPDAAEVEDATGRFVLGAAHVGGGGAHFFGHLLQELGEGDFLVLSRGRGREGGERGLPHEAFHRSPFHRHVVTPPELRRYVRAAGPFLCKAHIRTLNLLFAPCPAVTPPFTLKSRDDPLMGGSAAHAGPGGLGQGGKAGDKEGQTP